MKLELWLAENPEREGKLVEALDCHPKSVWRYKTGRKIPDRDAMLRIYVFSEGLVDPNAFYNLPEIKPGKKANKARRSA